MVELKVESPFAGLLPVEFGGVVLEEVDLGVLTSVMPLGDGEAAATALEKAHGLKWPAPNRATGKAGQRCLWFGRGEVLLAGPVPDPKLAKTAAVVDQSDGWAAAVLRGPGGADVLARLVPVEMRAHIFKRGHSVRTQLLHMNVSITRIAPDQVLILCYRSMAGTLVHDLKRAMAAVATRG